MTDKKRELKDAAENLLRALMRVAAVSESREHYLRLLELVVPAYDLVLAGMTPDQVIEKFRQFDMATQKPGGES